MSDRLRLIAFSRPPGLVAALEGGFFAREGLAVEVSRATSSRTQLRALLAGECEVAHTAVDNVLAYVDDGQEDVVLVLVGELGADQRLVARREIASAAALVGRTVGVDSTTSGYAFMLYAMLATAGVPRGAYAVLAVGGTAERLAALRDGRVDAALLGPPRDDAALAGGFRALGDAARHFPGYPALSAAVRRSWAAAHRDVLVRYCRALLAAIRWAADSAHRAEAVRLLGGDDAAKRYYARMASAREAAPPSVEEMARSVERVLALRREMTGRPAERGGVERYVDFSYAAAATS